MGVKIENNIPVLYSFLDTVWEQLQLKTCKPKILVDFSKTNLNAVHRLLDNEIVFTVGWRITTCFVYKGRLINPFLALVHECLHRKQYEEGDLLVVYDGAKFLGKEYKGKFYSRDSLIQMKRQDIDLDYEIDVQKIELQVFKKCLDKALFKDKALRAYFPKGAFNV